jgi:hypothetical protein
MTAESHRVAGRRDVQLSFVIPVRNDASRLARCLASINAAAADIPCEVIVLDHDSSDASAAVARASGARVLPGRGHNVAALRNAGTTEATASLLAFVDADHLLDREWVQAAIAAFSQPSIGAAGAPCHAPAEGTWVQRTYDALRRHPEHQEPAEWFGAGNMVVRRSAFDQANGFDETLETCEDVDLCFRLRAAGWTLLNVPSMRNVHLGDPPTLVHLFRGELWRGRDNLRVGLRAPWSLRNAMSTAAPAVQLAAVPTAFVALAFGGMWGRIAAAGALAATLAPVIGRTVAMARNAHVHTALDLARCAAVAATYDAGRALALLMRSRHHRRSPSATAAFKQAG